MPTPKQILRLIGLVSIVLAGWALLYVGISMLLTPHSVSDPSPYFLRTFYVMATVVVVINIALAWSGWQFVKGKFSGVPPFVFVLACACAYLLPTAVRYFANFPSFGHSVAGATGIALGGMLFQWKTEFPILAPLIVLFIWWYIARQSAKRA